MNAFLPPFLRDAAPRWSRWLLALLCIVGIGSSALADDIVWKFDAAELPTGTFQAPEDWILESVLDDQVEVVEIVGADGATVNALRLPNREGELTTLQLPLPRIGPGPMWLEVRIGSESGGQRGLNWFVKKQDLELRADDNGIGLFDPNARIRTNLRRAEPSEMHTVRLLYDPDTSTIIRAEIDGTPVEQFDAYPCQGLGRAGMLQIFAPTASGRAVLLQGVEIQMDSGTQ